jgi:hypothetical protein
MVREPVRSCQAPLRFYNVGQQNIHKRVLAIERQTSLIFGCRNSFDCGEVSLAECLCTARDKGFPSRPRAAWDRPNRL